MRIINYLQDGRVYNATNLAIECGISKRQIYRDLDFLRETDIPVEYDEQIRGYRLTIQKRMPADRLAPEELLALIILSHELTGQGGVPLLDSAKSATVKFLAALPHAVRESIREMSAAVEVRGVPKNTLTDKAPFFRVLILAISKRLDVRIRYKSPASPDDMQTRLSPYRLVFLHRSWYVIGRSSFHREVRTFNLGRCLDMELLESEYEIPKGFSLSRHLRNAWNLIPDSGPDQHVVIRFSPMVATNVAEVSWHKTQSLEWNEDGSLDFHADVSGLGEIQWWILGYGGQAEVIEPPALRDEIAKKIKAMSKLYE